MPKQNREENHGIYIFVLGWIAALLLAITFHLVRLFRNQGSNFAPPQLSESRIAPAVQETEQAKTEPPSSGTGVASPITPFWDVLGLSSVAVTIAGAAIFYIAGWVYEANWYGYYKIEISQVGLIPNQVMVQGFPGIFLVLVGLIISITWQYAQNSINSLLAILRSDFSDLLRNISIESTKETDLLPRIQKDQFRTIFLRAYKLAFLLLGLFTIYLSTLTHLAPSWEILVTLIPGMIIAIVIVVPFSSFMEPYKLFLTIFDPQQPIKLSTKLFYFPFWLAVEIMKKVYHKQILEMNSPKKSIETLLVKNKKLYKEVKLILESTGIPTEKPISSVDVLKAVFTFYEQLTNVISLRFSTFWMPLLVTLLFLVSISTSAALGKFDALRGARSLSGNWQIPMTYVFSNKKILSLAAKEIKVDGGYEYGSFGLIASTDTNLYLVTWKTDIFFKEQPSLYIIPVKPEQSILLGPKVEPSTAPTTMPSITPIATSTLMLTPTFTPSPTSHSLPTIPSTP